MKRRSKFSCDDDTPAFAQQSQSHVGGGIKPHFYCLPILKTESDRKVLLEAATSGDSRFFLGTDSAPHAQSAKENACGCAGCFTSYAALELYATAFESVGKLDKLANFAARFGADYYGLPYNEGEVVLRRQSWNCRTYCRLGKPSSVPITRCRVK